MFLFLKTLVLSDGWYRKKSFFKREGHLRISHTMNLQHFMILVKVNKTLMMDVQDTFLLHFILR